MLRSWNARQAEERLFLGPAYEDNDYVFCRGDGRPHHPDRFSREFERNQRYYNREHPDAPLPIIKLHGLRHTCDTGPAGRHRHQDRVRPARPLQHARDAGDLHPRDPANAERRSGTSRRRDLRSFGQLGPARGRRHWRWVLHGGLSASVPAV